MVPATLVPHLQRRHLGQRARQLALHTLDLRGFHGRGVLCLGQLRLGIHPAMGFGANAGNAVGPMRAEGAD